MAADGLNVCLISRTPAKLKQVADEISIEIFLNKFCVFNIFQYFYFNLELINSSIEIKTIAVDFNEGQSIYPKLSAELNRIQIGILINNVGMALKHGQPFYENEEDDVHNIINCNIMSMVRMCHIVLPQMIQRKSGVIINIGSTLSAMPSPLWTIYGGTKVNLYCIIIGNLLYIYI